MNVQLNYNRWCKVRSHLWNIRSSHFSDKAISLGIILPFAIANYTLVFIELPFSSCYNDFSSTPKNRISGEMNLKRFRDGNSYDRRNTGAVMYAAMKFRGNPATAHKISINRVLATELNGSVNAVFSGPPAWRFRNWIILSVHHDAFTTV